MSNLMICVLAGFGLLGIVILILSIMYSVRGKRISKLEAEKGKLEALLESAQGAIARLVSGEANHDLSDKEALVKLRAALAAWSATDDSSGKSAGKP